MLYDQYLIDDLRDRADLVRIIEPYAPLKKKGANWMACCPFHQEKTPSFSVNPSKGFYKCFGCGKGGNAFTFLMEMEGLSFPEAVRRVAEMTGTALPEPIDDKQYQQTKKKKEQQKKLSEELIELNRIALTFWEEFLYSGDRAAAAAHNYLEGRGITRAVLEQFRIGFAPNEWQALHEHLLASGANDKLIEQSGLVSKNEEKGRIYDRFRHRIIFPVLDVNGNPVAFGARAMGDEQPKYLNSPETAAYIKGKHLYGLHHSKEAIRQKKFAILVEGYLDLIALFQFGITNVSASLGTAFTPDQAKLLSRYTKRVVINYDGDAAGIKAAKRAIEELLPQDFDVKVLVLPDGLDPDDYIRSQGAERYNEARGMAMPFLQFTLDVAMKGRSMNNPRQKSDAIEEVLPAIAAIKNPIQKRQSFDDSMAFFRVDDVAVKRELWNTVKNGRRTESEIVRQQIKRVTQAKLTIAEQQLLELLIYDGELQDKILPILEESDYENLASAQLFRGLIDLHERGLEFSAEHIAEFIEDDEFLQDLLPILMMSEPQRVSGEVIDEVFHKAENCVFSLRSMAISNRILEISQEVIAAERDNDQNKLRDLIAEQLDLARMKHDLLSKIKEV
ncbi:DNA primase [Leptolyngbya sp. 7M]|uniref:DNA primase n=1 Tax=Leptolyngbya sp. 7M TaxID=2812896 RepID=UPI001B8ACEFB|nr:DNA primase [Leptolyngbya sp. 7M]QYO65883.1 DNA primase [Leptolyngbya sp. 7M]